MIFDIYEFHIKCCYWWPCVCETQTWITSPTSYYYDIYNESSKFLNTIWVWVFEIFFGYQLDFYTIQEISYPGDSTLVIIWYHDGVD